MSRASPHRGLCGAIVEAQALEPVFPQPCPDLIGPRRHPLMQPDVVGVMLGDEVHDFR